MRADLSHLLGVAGYALMLWCAFGYSWRKSLARRGPGAVRTWMRSHVVAGIVGPALVLAHGAWAWQGLAGVTMALTLVVVASGAIGRWIYTVLPAQPEPDDELARIDAELAEIAAAPQPRIDVGSGGAATMAPGRVERAVTEARVQTLRELRLAHEALIASATHRARWRRRLAWWWLLHVPLAAVVIVLALVHSIAALYYGAPWR